MKELYKSLIAEAVDACPDVDLLDLVWKMLLDEQEVGPAPVSNKMEVQINEDNQGNQWI